MIVGKLWRSLKAKMNKLANHIWKSDPIAQLQYEYDKAVDQLKEGRTGVEQYRALVERVTRQRDAKRAHVSTLEAKVRSFLAAGDRETAAPLALELRKARKELQDDEVQLQMHEEAYANHLTKVKYATGKLAELRDKIQKYDAELKMSRAEAELAKVANSIHTDVTTDFGEIEQVLQDEIDRNRAKAKVAADLSGEGLQEVKREMAVEKQLADQALREFELEMGTTRPDEGDARSRPKQLSSPARDN
jgi:phage shock protein A